MKKTTGPVKLRRGEKIILAFILLVTVMSPIVVVYGVTKLDAINIEVQELQKKIDEQENVNAGLSMQVDELASLSTVQDIAKENGLSYNNDNIVVVK